MLEKGDLITFNNQKEYLVLNMITFHGKNYVYLVSKDGVSSILIGLLENDTVTVVQDGNLISLLLEEFRKKAGIINE